MNDVYAERRAAVLAALEPRGALVIASAPVALRNNDVEHEYRQDSDLFYLTGFDEPESVLVLRPGAELPFVLFVRPRDPERETWDGRRAGCDGARTQYGADAAYPIPEFATQLVELLSGRSILYYQLGSSADMDQRVLTALAGARARARRGLAYPRTLVEPGTVVHEMRRVKSDEEIDIMQRAAAITLEAHVEAMQLAAPGVHEYEVEAALRGAFRRRGAERSAYAPIVASGANATILHYTRNDREMLEGDLLLIDAGCEFSYYASDVTRTFPVGGRFTDPQREIYEIVLQAQLASIENVAPGATLDAIHEASLRTITEGLIRIGLIEGPVDAAIEQERYKPFFMHKTSHYLGMDVHDVGDYFVEGRARPLDEGVVITVEPGIYVSEDCRDVPERYRGIGVRIEDDVLVTAGGYRNLTEAVPKSVEDLERTCAG